jgi:co-chaperonin GroES (HSP10)
MTNPRDQVPNPGLRQIDRLSRDAYDAVKSETHNDTPALWDVAHGSGRTELQPEDVRWLRGRVCVEVLPDVVSEVLVVVNSEDRALKVGPARVVAMGPPALTKQGHVVPYNFAVGELVYIYLPHKSRAIEMGGRMLHVVSHEEVVGGS